jgi:hypothetical protein
MGPSGMDLPLMEWEFSGELIDWRGPAPYHFIELPEEVAGTIGDVATLVTYGWGVIPVSARIGDSDFTTSLFPKDGGYLLPIKDAVRKAQGLVVGDAALVELRIRSLTPGA